MKKMYLFFITIVFCFLLPSAVSAATSLDTSNTAKGILTVTYDGDIKSKTIKLRVEITGNSTYYVYDVKTNSAFTVPLQLGDGAYKASLLENVSANKFKVLTTQSFDVKVTSANDMFLYASPIVNYDSTMNAIKGYNTFFTQKSAGDSNKKISALYEDVVNQYTYDNNKAKTVSGDYVPVIDDMYKSKTGICYDYSALMAGVLRAQGVPTRLCMGYAPEIDVYHAWNEIYKDNKWVVVDTTYDAAYAHAGQKYTMEKDGKLFKVLKTY